MTPVDFLEQWLAGGPDREVGRAIAFWARTIATVSVLVISLSLHFLISQFAIRAVERAVKQSRIRWDDIILRSGMIRWLVHLIPGVLIFLLTETALQGNDELIAGVQTVAYIYIVLVSLLALNAFLNSLLQIQSTAQSGRGVPLKVFVQVVQILLLIFGLILIISALVERPPGAVLAGLGAATAVLMLIFKDFILGLVAGVQLATNRMLKVGDWIAMPSRGADGTVIDVALTTIKVQNWDKTITSIPVYALVSDSFTNWAGMEQAGGRRIKRSIFIDSTSIQVCQEPMLKKFRKIRLLKDYLAEKEKELADWNASFEDANDTPVNARSLTNIGTFRAYILAYLERHPQIRKDMTLLVRQLQPTEQGVPIEVYCFTNDIRWAYYEGIQSDIFDHLLSVAREFGLRVYQKPSGQDLGRALQDLADT
ncbi:MAG: mechanosensitive ion channel family protein [Verrucomicrobiota bacterium]